MKQLVPVRHDGDDTDAEADAPDGHAQSATDAAIQDRLVGENGMTDSIDQHEMMPVHVV